MTAGISHRLSNAVAVPSEAAARLRDIVSTLGVVRAQRELGLSPETLQGAMTGARFRQVTVDRIVKAIGERDGQADRDKPRSQAMIRSAVTYEVHRGVNAPKSDHAHQDLSYSRDERFSGPHRSFKVAAKRLAQARKRYVYAWITFAKDAR